MQYVVLLAIVLASPAEPVASDSALSKKQQAIAEYKLKRKRETAAARRLVADWNSRDWISRDLTTNDERYRLSRAYNEVGKNSNALSAINAIPESWLAKHHKLQSKYVLYENVLPHDWPTVRENGKDLIYFVRELAFIQRCIDKGHGNRAVWQWRKASLLCRTSARTDVHIRAPTVVLKTIYNRSQYDDAFETLKAALAAEPRLDEIDGSFGFWMISGWDSRFPVLSREPRFKRLMSKYRNHRKKTAIDRPSTK